MTKQDFSLRNRRAARPSLRALVVAAMMISLPTAILQGVPSAQALAFPTDIVSLDLDSNGHLDAVQIDFGTDIIRDSVYIQDFVISGTSAYDLITFELYVAADKDDAKPSDPTRPTGQFVRLIMEEKQEFDTGAALTLEYTQGFLASTAGSFDSPDIDSTTGPLAVTDGAPPVFHSAIAQATAETSDIILGFSEPVSGTPAGFTIEAYNAATGTATAAGAHTASPIGASGAYFILNIGDSTHGPILPAPAGSRTEDLATGTYDRIGLGAANIKDAEGLDAVSAWKSASDITEHVYIQLPGAVAAETNIGSHHIDIRFNCAVTDPTGDLPFGIAQPVGSGIIGIDGVEDRESDSDILRLLLTAPDGRAPGVDGAFVAGRGSIAPNDVSGKGISADPGLVQIVKNAVACFDPRASGDAIPPVPAKDVPITDNEPPRLLAAFTQDVDRDGYIDQYELRFSEPVDNTVFEPRMEDDCDLRKIFRIDQQPGKNDDPTSIANISEFSKDRDCSSYRIVGDLEDRGHIVRIEFEELNNDPAIPLTTGERPNILIPAALVAGATCNTPFVAGAADCAPFLDLARPQNPVAGTQSGDVLEKDGAEPLIDFAKTIDSQPNGLIDGIHLEFSEPIDDNDLGDPKDWDVEGQTVSDLLVPPGAVLPSGGILALILNLQEKADFRASDGNTGLTPRVVYEGDADSIRDLSENSMIRFEDQSFKVLDGAQPVVMKVFGKPGEDRVIMIFSEGVEAYDEKTLDACTQSGKATFESGESDPGRSIVRTDIVYQNNNGIEGNTGLDRVVHGLGQKLATLFLIDPLSETDQNTDQITPRDFRIREASGTIPEECRLVLVRPDEERRRIVEAEDLVPPGDVDDLAVSVQGVTSITLTWTAPGDDGEEGDPVGGYVIKVSDEGEITPDLFDGAVTAGGTNSPFGVEFTPATLAGPGDAQTATITSLKPNTEYHFALIAEDDSEPFVSDVSNSVSGQTEADTSAPVPVTPGEVFAVTSLTHLLDTNGDPIRSKNGDVGLEWTLMHDPETGGAVYRYGLIAEENIIEDLDGTPDFSDAILESKNLTDETILDLDNVFPGNWTFFVVAENGDGLATEPATYRLGIDPPITEDECIANNRLIAETLTAVREDGITTVRWEFTDDLLAQLLGVEPEGVQVWRRADGSSPFELLDDLSLRHREVEGNQILDGSQEASGSNHYLVTLYYGGNFCRYSGLDPDIQAEGFDVFLSEDVPTKMEGDSAKTRVIEPPPTVPVWVWLVIGIIAVLIAAGIVLMFLLRRTRLDESWLDDEELGLDEIDPEEGEDEDEGLSDDPFGDDADAGDEAGDGEGDESGDDNPFG